LGRFLDFLNNLVLERTDLVFNIFQYILYFVSQGTRF
jgi:hypothetical protein